MGTQSGEQGLELLTSGFWNDLWTWYQRRAVIEWSADCNGDGIVDYGQIRAGELDDADSDNVPDCCESGSACGCPADVDASGAVNAIDLAVILSNWGTDGGKYPGADVDRSGTVDAVDLAEVLNGWGPCD